MKKVLYIIGSIVLVIVLILILMFTGVLPNIFLDRSDLVCSRIRMETDEYVWKEVAIIKFDNLALSKNGTEQTLFIYSDETLAKKDYDETKQNLLEYDDIRVELDGKIVSINKFLSLNSEEKNLKKEGVAKIYERYGYKCE